MPMEIINTKTTVNLTVAVSVILITISIVYSYYIFLFQGDQFYPWIHQFLATLVAAALAFTLGLAVYMKQVADRKKRIKNLLETYLQYLLNQVKPQTNLDNVSMYSVNAHILNEVIASGDFNKIAPRLIYLQALIETYQLLGNATVSKIHKTNNKVKPWEQDHIHRTANVLIKETERCIKLLKGQAILENGIKYIELDKLKNQ